MFSLWKEHRLLTLLGITACVAIVVASASSGPILSAAAGLFALWTWRHRTRLRLMRWSAVVGYVLLDLVMKDPAYFLVARIDLAGGSTSWYRARLIQSAFEHLSEWWLIGTDNTREWMWVVVSWSPNHTDITSHYIQMGVWGGLPLLILFVLVLLKGFSRIGHAYRSFTSSKHTLFALWTVGSSLFALTVTGLSVSYFDQSIIFLYLVLGIIGALRSAVLSGATNSGTDRARRASFARGTRAALPLSNAAPRCIARM
jgi:hypothetical protein